MDEEFNECMITLMQHPIMEKPISQLSNKECKVAYLLLGSLRNASMKEDILFDAFQIARLEAHLAELAVAMKYKLEEIIEHYEAVACLLQEGGFDLSLQRWLELVDPSRPYGQMQYFKKRPSTCINRCYEALLEHPITRKPISQLSVKECIAAIGHLGFIAIAMNDELYSQRDYIQMARSYLHTAQLSQRVPFSFHTITQHYQMFITLLNKGGIDLSLKKWIEVASLR